MKDIEGIEKVLKVLEPHWKEIEEDFDLHNRLFLKLAAADHATIGRVLRVHLVIEHFLNIFLTKHYEIEDLEGLKLSFFQKAKLLPTSKSSAAFVRLGILQLNAVRNKFGHNLEPIIEESQIASIMNVLTIARPNSHFNNSVDAIEAFAPVACAFLSVPPPHLQELFMQAFADVHSYNPPS